MLGKQNQMIITMLHRLIGALITMHKLKDQISSLDRI
jgi:hypothetical protein